jgi:hypothetical protein
MMGMGSGWGLRNVMIIPIMESQVQYESYFVEWIRCYLRVPMTEERDDDDDVKCVVDLPMDLVQGE